MFGQSIGFGCTKEVFFLFIFCFVCRCRQLDGGAWCLCWVFFFFLVGKQLLKKKGIAQKSTDNIRRHKNTTGGLWGRGHDGLVNCVRTGMSKSVGIAKTCVAANAIYSHKFAGHDALVNTFVATYE